MAPNEQLQQIKEAEQIYLHNQILLPGFVNGHNHMYGFYSHGISADAVVTEFSSFLEDFWWPYVENRLDHRYIQAATRWACIEMIESGVTSFVDILEAPNAIPGGLDAEKEVVQASGLRGKLTFEACERISKENADAGLMENDRFVRENKGEHHLVQGINSIHTLFTGSDEFIKKAKRMPAKTVYQMATSMGSKAIGLEDAGSIREGNLADLISVDILLPTPINEKNIYDQLILFCNPHNVVNVMVDGQWLKRDGVLTTMDKEKARQELRQATEEFWKFQ